MTKSTDPSRVTETHIRCTQCDQWKLREHYHKKRRTCKDCRYAQARRRYRNLSSERLDAYLAQQVRNKKRHRKRETDKRLKEALDGVRALRRRGYSYYRIGKLCGACGKTIRMIDEGKRRYHKRATLDRIYEGLFVAINTGG